jgi:hypothetical protein
MRLAVMVGWHPVQKAFLARVGEDAADNEPDQGDQVVVGAAS